MNRLIKHKLVVGGVVLLAAGSAGGAYAATQTAGNSRQAFLNDVAKRLNVTPSELRSAVTGAFLDRLQAEVKAGQLTQAQADRIKQRIEQGGPPGLGELKGPMGRRLEGPMGGPLRGPMLRPGFAPGPAPLLGSAAGYLGVSLSQLIGDLQSGKSLAQVAQARGKSVSGLEQILLEAARTRLDRLVSAGVLTRAQEQRRLNRLSTRIDRLVSVHPHWFSNEGAVPPPPPGSPPAPGSAPPTRSPSTGVPSGPPPAA